MRCVLYCIGSTKYENAIFLILARQKKGEIVLRRIKVKKRFNNPTTAKAWVTEHRSTRSDEWYNRIVIANILPNNPTALVRPIAAQHSTPT